MGTILLQDLPPFVTASGNAAEPHGVNAEGLKRRGFSATAITSIKRAYKILYKSGLSLDQARAQITAAAQTEPALLPLAQFLATPGRGIIR